MFYVLDHPGPDDENKTQTVNTTSGKEPYSYILAFFKVLLTPNLSWVSPCKELMSDQHRDNGTSRNEVLPACVGAIDFPKARPLVFGV